MEGERKTKRERERERQVGGGSREGEEEEKTKERRERHEEDKEEEEINRFYLMSIFVCLSHTIKFDFSQTRESFICECFQRQRERKTERGSERMT